MLCLPDPPSEFLKDLNTVRFNFLWKGKPDRIKRTTVQGEYQTGGQKMTDIFSFCKSLKITWIKRVLISESVWTYIVKSLFPEMDTMLWYGSAFPAKLTELITSSFWKDVLNILRSFRKNYPLKILWNSGGKSSL